jgi:CheY-like chemotaxis protein
MITALVIDDNRQTADSICRLLKLLGVDARSAYGSRTGILKLKKKVPDVVFLDLNMPGVDGFEVLAYIRRLPHMENVPVVVITSDDQPETADKVLDLGAKAFVLKPAGIEELEIAIREVGLMND